MSREKLAFIEHPEPVLTSAPYERFTTVFCAAGQGIHADCLFQIVIDVQATDMPIPLDLTERESCTMKIALIGATGFVGSAILKEALDRGHDVTAIVRHPDKLHRMRSFILRRAMSTMRTKWLGWSRAMRR